MVKIKKFNTFSGVFLPSSEAILGAVLFLLLPMLTCMVGFKNISLIILLAHTVTIATSFSIADCVTNLTKVQGGGMYAISKNSVGLAFGGSIGIQLYLAQSLSIAFYAIGFSEPLCPILSGMPFIGKLLVNYSILMQKQIIATIMLTIFFSIAIAGADFTIKIQKIIFVILMIAISSIFASPFLKLGFSNIKVYLSNINMDGIVNSNRITFWVAFAAFFPAVTGLDAGVGMSGNLLEPRKSLVKGTFISIIFTMIIYFAVAYILSFLNPILLIPDDAGQTLTIVQLFSANKTISIFILTGILVATGSSALSCFMTAPRTLQALAVDNVLPKLLLFFKHGAEPRAAVILTYLIALPVIWSGNITTASMIVGISFLIVYGWVNLAAFLERFSHNPNFRPTNWNHWLISLYGFLMCILIISLFNKLIGATVLITQSFIFYLILRYKTNNKLEGVWWGVIFTLSRWGMDKLNSIVQGSKNWRPIMKIFKLSDKPAEKLGPIELGSIIGEQMGITLLHILRLNPEENIQFTLPKESTVLDVNKDNIHNTIMTLVKSPLPGGLETNSVLIEYDDRINFPEIIEQILREKKDILIYKPRQIYPETNGNMDIYWRGAHNGNFMSIIAYTISISQRSQGLPQYRIRIIRSIPSDEDKEKIETEMNKIFNSARLDYEVIIIQDEDDKKDFADIVREHSANSELIIMGVPGEYKTPKLIDFIFNKDSFPKQINKFSDLPPILFIKARGVFNLFEW